MKLIVNQAQEIDKIIHALADSVNGQTVWQLGFWIESIELDAYRSAGFRFKTVLRHERFVPYGATASQSLRLHR